MKKFFIMLLAAGIAGGAFAQEATTVSIRKVGSSKVAVSSSEEVKGAMIVRIKDEQGDLIFRDRISKSDSYKKLYDLSQVERGTFNVEVVDQKGALATATVSNIEEVRPLVYSRVSQMENDTYRLLVSAPEEEELKVLIFDGGKLIHTEMVLSAQGLHKIYKVKRASEDGISFKIETASGFEEYVSEK